LSSPSISTSVARVGADVGEDGAQDVDSQSVEHAAAIFFYEDQLRAQLENAVSTTANIAFVAHRPTVS
jgi:putative transposase